MYYLYILAINVIMNILHLSCFNWFNLKDFNVLEINVLSFK